MPSPRGDDAPVGTEGSFSPDPTDGGRPESVDTATDACIPAAVDGDDAAFALLYRDLNPRLLRYAAVFVGQEAEDVVSEAWLQIARDLRRFRGDLTDLRAWTARIVRNRSLDHIRAAKRRPVPSMDLSAIVDRPSADDTAVSADETISTGRAIAMIAALPRGQAEAVLLRAVFGLDPVASGKILGRRPGAVRVAAHRGLRRLAEQLAVDGPSDGGGHA